ncbi:transporter substrate-binding domain-containing protein [Chromobacterium subtsugae]|uniref:Transporter substrate-binding domain-containing protein n=1 Tax=Chromobacterium subtsugae TaxID=251747 RepID=A0ABS7FJW1_9NEIS|nr:MULTISPECIES: transporter substrate-binding domain-containing protein [Chromobacterium]MBW7565538.1 transporter substrate-binding domain-containing protein [Chromobacterium subtsugae]MBW8290374.1 transporter substrate-binding domain-containing protein [Chromobacterium subtsugae]WSE89634.1 transporter substrate-binding domain-containing protein [Chromobacterium subtsugae]WVH58005.1 transporter substrate-binding domain-containing protein [Chromobacterium subtsugae]
MKWLAACLLALCLAAARAAPNPACPQGALAIAYYDFGIAYRQGKGYDPEIIHELARRLNCPIQSETDYPRLRVLKLLEIGQADIGTSTLITPERQRYLWLLPYHHSKNMVLLHRGVQANSLAELLKLPDLRWGMVRGYRHSPAQQKMLDELTLQHKVVVAENEDDLYKMVCNGVVSAAFGHTVSYDPWLQNHQAQQQVTVHDFFPDSEIIAGGIALSKARFSQGAAELWSEEVRRMLRDGSMRAIMRRHLSPAAVEQLFKQPLE